MFLHHVCSGCENPYWTNDPTSQACERCTRPFILPAAYGDHNAQLNALPVELRHHISELEDHVHNCPLAHVE